MVLCELDIIGPFIQIKYYLTKEDKDKCDNNLFLQEVRKLCDKIDNRNHHMQAYIDNLEQSYALYGTKGFTTQILYIYCNFIAKTDNDKNIKKILLKISKTK
jgi:hypothetical protein